jgi:glycosyltransferase involved in cell wall biosynthesis
MARLVESGHTVFAYSVDDGRRAALEALGVIWRELPLYRGGFHPTRDLRLLKALVHHYRGDRLELVQHFHAKPMVFGSIAARQAGVGSVVNTVTGLGESLPESGPRAWTSGLAYRIAGRLADRTVFQNSDDRALFLSRCLVVPGLDRLIVSSGVDIERFVPPGNGHASEPPRILFMSRLLHAKGVAEFVEAARRVKRSLAREVRFELAGEWDSSHPDAVTAGELDAMNHDQAIHFVGYQGEPDLWLRGAAVFVCPSYYREGVPRTILEANASGVPVIGVDAPGIRDAIRDGVNGFLVPPRDAGAITDRLLRLLTDPELAGRMMRDARTEAENRFDIAVVTRQYEAMYAELGVNNTTED